ncbi:FtsX-like permease family protein [Blastococcus sp. CT_GayMR16]|uniref:FtsX-like permease family protein n=1 Tax=Blastococcus sp. CT_GayMR16 TaxID=2559607 RepID=UPI0010743A6D|nr:FtsX-like permease family protein [Blastococcus sp. CT_GayMR16]TFV86275.1 FtsX-like permease family protein [Blastococcus sp. CT_GayMR16]
MITSRYGPRSVLRRLRLRLLPVPSQALGLAVLVAVLAAALVSGPLMVASAEQGAWQQERDRVGQNGLGSTFGSSTLVGRQVSAQSRIARIGELDDAVVASVADAGLNAPVSRATLNEAIFTASPHGFADVQLFFGTGAQDDVEIVAGAPSETGVLIPQELAQAAGVGPGQNLAVQGEHGDLATLQVSGVYTTPTLPLDPYWEGLGFLFLPTLTPLGELEYPPAAILASKQITLATALAVDEDVLVQWLVPIDDGTDIAGARTAADDFGRLQAAMADPESAVTQLIAAEAFPRPAPESALPTSLETVDRTVGLLSPPVRAVGIGGGAAALVLVGAWAGQRIRRREDELRSLITRGLSPARGAGQAATEALLPGALGLAVGGLVGWLLVRELGPAADLGPETLQRSLVALAAGGVAALAVVAGVTAARLARLDQIGRGPAAQLLGRVPWLAVTAAVTVVTAVPLVTGGSETERGFGVLTLVVPLLATVVVAGVVTAGLPLIGRRADARLRRLPPGAFLAARRVLAGQGAARLVVVTTALSLGLVVYAGALADSTARTIATKASVATGSDVVAPVARGASADGPIPAGAMVVGVENDATLVPGDRRADVLVVHPEQVADVVRWNDALADQPLDELMSALADYDGDRVPVVLAGGTSESALAATDGGLTLDFEYYTLPVDVVAQVDAFPGQGSRDALLVADWDRYLDALEAADRDPDLVLSRMVWARGEPGEVVDALATAGYVDTSTADVETAAEFAARPELNAQTWALSYLRAVALAAGVLGLVGLAMQAMAQQRRRTVAGLLLSRMGMSRGAADRASGLEIGLLAALGALVAAAVALPASALVLHLLDPVPTLPPGPLFATPWPTIAAVVVGVVLVTVLGATLVGRSARRATGGQVMRDAT